MIDANLIVGATFGFAAGAAIATLICIIIFGWLLSIKEEKKEKDARLHHPAL